MPLDGKNSVLKTVPADRLKPGFRVMGKYGLSSLTATGVDFLTFHLSLTALMISAVQATVTGRCVGAVISFLIQRRWVFQAVRATRWSILAVKYVGGVFLGMGLNVGGVWLLHDAIGWTAWPARIASATTGWLILYFFNRRVVFQPATNRPPIKYRR